MCSVLASWHPCSDCSAPVFFGVHLPLSVDTIISGHVTRCVNLDRPSWNVHFGQSKEKDAKWYDFTDSRGCQLQVLLLDTHGGWTTSLPSLLCSLGTSQPPSQFHLAWASRSVSENLPQGYPHQLCTGPGLGWTEVGMRESGLDYIPLGHYSLRKEIRAMPRILGACPGSHLTFNELQHERERNSCYKLLRFESCQ